MTGHSKDKSMNFKQWLQRYKKWLLVLLLLILVGIAALFFWKRQQQITDQNLSAILNNLIEQHDVLRAGNANADQLAAFYSRIDQLFEDRPNSAHAIQSSFLAANVAVSQNDFPKAERYLSQVANSSIDDKGLKSLIQLRLAYVLEQQNKLDDALKTLDQIKVNAFMASANEARGDILVKKKDEAGAKRAYQRAWDLLVERKEQRLALQAKMGSLGLLVDDIELDSAVKK